MVYPPGLSSLGILYFVTPAVACSLKFDIYSAELLCKYAYFEYEYAYIVLNCYAKASLLVRISADCC